LARVTPLIKTNKDRVIGPVDGKNNNDDNIGLWVEGDFGVGWW